MAAMSVAQLAEKVQNDPGLAAKLKDDPHLLVVIGGFITELWAVGANQPKKALPDGLLALGTTAPGVLGGLFISSPNDK